MIDHLERLREAGVPTPEVDLRWLRRLATAEMLDDLVEQRALRVPLQHLVGTVQFRHLELLCDNRALIPRPETEVTAEVAIKALIDCKGRLALDLCTGAGPIALSLANEVPGAHVVATDISAEAMALAAENASRTGLVVDFRLGDLFEPVRGQTFDVVVANPPYLSVDEIDLLEPEVRDHDPRLALVSGPTGREVLERILREAPSEAIVILEIAPHQAEWAQAHGRLVDDLTGRPRVLVRDPSTGGP